MRWLKWGVLSVVAVLSGCADEGRDEFESARSRWQAQNATTYVFVYRHVCFCPDTMLARVVVEDGEPVSAIVEDGGSAEDRRVTIDSLLDDIDGWLSRDPAEFSASYDPTWGYPRQASADMNENAVDDEIALEVTCFEAGDSAESLASACPLE